MVQLSSGTRAAWDKVCSSESLSSITGMQRHCVLAMKLAVPSCEAVLKGRIDLVVAASQWLLKCALSSQEGGGGQEGTLLPVHIC